MPKTKRKRCRVCSALAGLTADICNGCRMAEVRSHIKARGPKGKPKGDVLHDAYGKSLVSLPAVQLPTPKAAPSKDYTTAAIFSSVSTGLEVSANEVHRFNVETLANAQRFAATLGGVPTDSTAAQVFFSYSQKSFYNHMRAIMQALDPSKKLPGRKRKTPTTRKDRGKGAQSADNVALAKAMRFIRIYMHVETIPLALKLDCSQTAIWHIESCSCRIQPKWVESYAKVFEIEERSIYAFATCISRYKKTDFKAMVADFVDICLRNKRVTGTKEFEAAIFSYDVPNNNAKLNKVNVRQIKAAIAKGERAALIADRFNVSRSAVQDIKKGRTWHEA